MHSHAVGRSICVSTKWHRVCVKAHWQQESGLHKDEECPADSDPMADCMYMLGHQQFWVEWKDYGRPMTKRFEQVAPTEEEIPQEMTCLVPAALAFPSLPPGPLKVAFMNASRDHVGIHCYR